jgi:hypothetical protein
MTFIQEFKSEEDIINQYRAPADSLDGANVLLAWYGYGDYSGYSLVIFERDAELFEVNGSHCSCNGLEGQWQPEKTSWDVLALRNLTGSGYDGGNEAHAALAVLVAENSHD